MARLLHLNGPPGIGKSTIARRYAGEHAGVLNLDIDLLRTMIGGWEADFIGAGHLVRPIAIAMIEQHLAGGRDVILPQMILNRPELALFEGAAVRAGATYMPRYLVADVEEAVERFERRSSAPASTPWHREVIAVVDAEGGPATLRQWHARLERLRAGIPGAVSIPAAANEIDETYRLFVASLT